ncbi:MAG TPA: helix-turn-helix domain-containing protein [Syntrophobacteraceae bacterium]|mgnify:CR=1 FL=1|nr:helix-turn-helix domain-containing protein [Syntrophobacteraceae bacterium]
MIVLRVSQLAERLGVHRNTIRNWIKSGKLPTRSVDGKRYLITEEDFSRLCQQFGLDGSSMRLKYVPGGPVIEKPAVKPDENLRKIGTRSLRLRPDPQWADVCVTCGSCASACPLSGVDGMDPRKAIRMAVLGLEDELIESQWPWKCTLCGKCEEACPMRVEIVSLLQLVRRMRPRERIPGPLHKGVLMCIEKGNNLGIPKDDFVSLLREMGREMNEDGYLGFSAPIDVRGANLMVTVNSKEPFAEPDDMKFWWKIFYAAGESWTIPSEYWEGVNWGFLTGDDDAMRTIVGRIVQNMHRLECKTLLLPECGHAYYATLLGLHRWFKDDLQTFEVVSVFDLLYRYLQEGRIRVDPSRHPQLTTYHDSCNYGRHSLKAFGKAYFEEGRAITRQCAPNFVEMYPNRAGNYCCGGGGSAWAVPFKEERVFHGRFKARQIENTKAKLVIASCHNCRDQIMKSLRKEYNLDIQVKYLWELVADSLVL